MCGSWKLLRSTSDVQNIIFQAWLLIVYSLCILPSCLWNADMSFRYSPISSFCVNIVIIEIKIANLRIYASLRYNMLINTAKGYTSCFVFFYFQFLLQKLFTSEWLKLISYAMLYMIYLSCLLYFLSERTKAFKFSVHVLWLYSLRVGSLIWTRFIETKNVVPVPGNMFYGAMDRASIA